VRGHRIVIGIAGSATCAWCVWVSGFHRTTLAAEITWMITLVAVILVDLALWRGTASGRLDWHLEPVREPWPRHGRGGSGPALRGVAPWLLLSVVLLVWEVLGIDTGSHQYHLTISALAQAYRPLNAGLLIVWVLVGIGYEAARVRAPIDGDATWRQEGRPQAPEHGGSFTMAVGSLGVHHGAPALLLPQNPPVGVALWVAIPFAAVLIDWAARRSHGRRARAEEFVRFISTARLANYALVATWGFAGYHLFAR
jgi:hypothetical protein